jgi:hypothetical protein
MLDFTAIGQFGAKRRITKDIRFTVASLDDLTGFVVTSINYTPYADRNPARLRSHGNVATTPRDACQALGLTKTPSAGMLAKTEDL